MPGNPAERQSSSLAKAWQLRSKGLLGAAEDNCHAVLSRNPECGEAWHLLGLLSHDRGDHSSAVIHLERAIAVEAGQPAYLNNLGVVLLIMQRYDQAASVLKKALNMSSDFQDARCNLGLAFYHQNHLDDAARCFSEILDTVPNHSAALANLGMTRLAQQMYVEAVNAYDKAVAVCPDQAQLHGNLGAAYVRLGQYRKAAECYRRAADLEPSEVHYDIYRGIAMRAAGNLTESIRLLEGVLSRTPNHPLAIAHLVVGLEYTCQWDKLDLFHPLLDRATQNALEDGRRPDEDPMLNIRRCDDIALNQAVSRAWSLEAQNRARQTKLELIHTHDKRDRRQIRLGYLSYDFRNHPVAHQLFPLFGLHDRNRFHTTAFSMGPDDGSFFRKQIMAGCDKFIDISTQGLAQAARTIYEHKIDILVDLMGHSHHNRLALLALRPAPLQVGYLGFLSSTGAQFIDYLVTDGHVVSKDHASYFDEKLLRMPHCYQFSHKGLMGEECDSQREHWGLPAEGFVFCCFNTVYKIDRELFDTWMRILLRVRGSVLWLNGGHQTARRQMRRRALRLGIDPNRLVFAEKIALEEHLRRIPLADLALDTIRYNGGATTANTLGGGVPVLTVMGRHWVSRMSASQLTAVGMRDLVCPDMAAYEQTAIELALNEDRLRILKQRLKKNIVDHALFDSHAFVRQLETGFETIWERYQRGSDPIHMDIPATPRRIVSEDQLYGQDLKARHTIYYCCPDTPAASAGMRRLFRHVALLQRAGLPAFLLLEKGRDFDPDIPDVPVARINDVGDDPSAIFVIPEGLPKAMLGLKDHPGRRFVIALSWSYIFSTLPDGMDWRHMNIERVLAASPVVGRMIHWSMGLPVHHLASSIDHRLYYHTPEKKEKCIAFIRRKAEHVQRLQCLLASRNSDYINKIKWVGLDGLSLKAYADHIRRSAIFLSTSMAEGFPTSCLEAMAAGAVVCGYDGVGGRQILCPDGQGRNAMLSSNGDYVSLAYRMAPLLDDLLENRMDRWQPMIARARKTALKFTAQKETEALIAFWVPFVYGPEAGKHHPAKQTLGRPPSVPSPDFQHECNHAAEN